MSAAAGKGGSVPVQEGDGSVRITLKDVYDSNQALTERVADSFAQLNLTLAHLTAHLDKIDQRNNAADQIHLEHSTRIRALEDAQISSETIASTQGKSEAARKHAIGALITAGLTAGGLLLQWLSAMPHRP